MNRKIYFNDKFIEFIEPELQSSQNQDFKFFESLEHQKAFDEAVNEFMNTSKKTPITLRNIRFKDALKVLKERFYYIEAAGGFIEREQEFLYIRRHDRWDLPKGKLEKKESVEDA